MTERTRDIRLPAPLRYALAGGHFITEDQLLNNPREEGDSLQHSLQHHCFDHRPLKFVECCRDLRRPAIGSAAPLHRSLAPKISAKFANVLAPRWARRDTCFHPVEIRNRASARHAHKLHWYYQLGHAAAWRGTVLATLVADGGANQTVSCRCRPSSPGALRLAALQLRVTRPEA